MTTSQDFADPLARPPNELTGSPTERATMLLGGHKAILIDRCPTGSLAVLASQHADRHHNDAIRTGVPFMTGAECHSRAQTPHSLALRSKGTFVYKEDAFVTPHESTRLMFAPRSPDSLCLV